MTGIEAFLEVLAAAGVTHIFGNPGTTELPLNAALTHDARFRYIFGVQEIPVIAMADGYAQASGQVGVANVHVTCGLGNSMGMLYNAHIEGTPLFLTAGQQDRRLRFSEPVLHGDVVRLAEPLTKWAYEVQRVQDVPQAVRRAVQTALAPPRGPVFLALPMDLQMEEAAGLDCSPPSIPDGRIRPSLEGLRSAAQLLLQARHPVILAGSRVAESDACAELAALAECLGAPVFAEGTPAHGRLPMATDHPQYRGILRYFAPEVSNTLQDHDVVLAVGLELFKLYIYREPAAPLPRHVRLIHLDNVPWEIGKNHSPEIGLIGDPKCGLAELLELLRKGQTGTHATRAAERRKTLADQRRQERQKLSAEIDEQRPALPMTPLVFMEALAGVLPEDVAVVEEAVTTHLNVFERLGVLKDPKGFFAHRGWALGWGMGCALGVKLAWPDRPMLAVIGDGAALYGIQALWSAAHHQIPVTFVIANNSEYRILKVCGDVLDMPELREPRCPGMNLTGPDVDFVGLARALGVEAHRVMEPQELSDRARAGLASASPVLLDAKIAR
ncbi:MAG: thiamine pyrophosphate-dependent enzyme [Gemmataceae bacterium]|nr:thiamine pyrophosphate-dependent enzyme [Gemmataceae bacterium]MCI0740325.1 thiamine pyrophosphate-dependent enzyme [Gemmataceae bacterium]